MISKYELQNIISGTGGGPKSNFIQAAARFLRPGPQTGGETEEIKHSKGEEEQKLKDWIEQNGYWFHDLDESRYLTRGAEQKVYLDINTNFVLKLNDAIFYASWSDYFHSLLMNNFFFPNTAYELAGFYKDEHSLFAVVRQSYIHLTETTDLLLVQTFLEANGFRIIRNNDYVNEELGIILEDIHDENVLVNSGVLFFIDTVFYLK
jgi:hypothetical protein